MHRVRPHGHQMFTVRTGHVRQSSIALIADLVTPWRSKMYPWHAPGLDFDLSISLQYVSVKHSLANIHHCQELPMSIMGFLLGCETGRLPSTERRIKNRESGLEVCPQEGANYLMIDIQIHFASTVRVALQQLKLQREPLCISAVRSVKKVAADILYLNSTVMSRVP